MRWAAQSGSRSGFSHAVRNSIRLRHLPCRRALLRGPHRCGQVHWCSLDRGRGGHAQAVALTDRVARSSGRATRHPLRREEPDGTDHRTRVRPGHRYRQALLRAGFLGRRSGGRLRARLLRVASGAWTWSSSRCPTTYWSTARRALHRRLVQGSGRSAKHRGCGPLVYPSPASQCACASSRPSTTRRQRPPDRRTAGCGPTPVRLNWSDSVLRLDRRVPGSTPRALPSTIVLTEERSAQAIRNLDDVEFSDIEATAIRVETYAFAPIQRCPSSADNLTMLRPRQDHALFISRL